MEITNFYIKRQLLKYNDILEVAFTTATQNDKERITKEWEINRIIINKLDEN